MNIYSRQRILVLRWLTFPEEWSLHTEAAGSAPPDAVGPFRVLHQIGAGTLGPVFRAYEPDRDRLVAIKLFRLDLPPERVHQFVAELELLSAAGLTDAGVAAPLAAGIEGNSAYLVQDYVAADSLDIVLRGHGAAPPVDALRLAAQAAGALDFAAGLAVGHGALHPRDVLLSPDQMRLTGLGVARALERVGVAAPVRRPYSAPERVTGGAWDRRADVFSLAALLHETLWGRRVNGLGLEAAAALTELPGARLDALRDAFARALADDPADRFATAREFVEALSAAFPGITVVDGPRSKAGRSTDARRSTREPRLPLDAPEAVEDVDLRAAESARFQDVEVALAPAPSPIDLPAIEPPNAFERPSRRAPSIDAELEPPLPVAPAGLLTADEIEPISALERSRSALWPLALAFVVGAALAFGAGYALGNRDRAVASVAAALPAVPPAAQPAVPVREWTEGAVSEAPKPPTPAARLKPDAAGSPSAVRGAPPAAGSAATPVTSVAPAPAVDNAGRLVVRSTPAGARVFVDGRDHGRTPATIRDLTRGAHRVRLVREGYATEERRVVVSTAHPSQSVIVTLARTQPARPAPPASDTSAGSLSVESRPAGAKVFVDGKPVGTTPLTLPQITPGAHVVRLEHDGYRRWTSPVRIVSGERNRVTASLER